MLWKAHIIPDADTQFNSLRPINSRTRPFSRLSTAFVHLGDHIRLPVIGTSSLGRAGHNRARFDRPLPPTPPPEPVAPPYVSSPTSSSSSIERRRDHDGGSIPAPKRPPSPGSSEMFNVDIQSRSAQTARHHLADELVNQSSQLAQPQITLAAASPMDLDHLLVLPRSDIGRLATGPNSSGTNPPGINASVTIDGTPPASGLSESSRKLPGGSLLLQSRTRTVPSSVAIPIEALQHSISSVEPTRQDPENTFVRFWRDLPSWLNARPSCPPSKAAVLSSARDEGQRRMKGEVVCLHYGTIDDAG